MKIWIALGLALLCSSCGSEKLEVAESEMVQPTFSSIRDRIFIPRCAMCHSGIVSHSLLTSSSTSKENSTRIVAGDAQNSDLYQQILGGGMPQYGDKLKDYEIKAVKDWIDRGAMDD